MKPTLKKVNNSNMSKIRQDLVFEKIGYDWANKKCIVRVYDSLNEVVNTDMKKSWATVVRNMFVRENDMNGLNRINEYGYYSTIRNILKDIKVIQYNGKQLSKGPNWDRFYGEEDWGWFVTNTNGSGYGEIVK